MGLHQNRNGLFNMCDNGLVQLSDCAGFDCRPIIYVDKHASGTGDGSSWANAYTDIQTAINENANKEIHIKGYGENDYYPGGIILKGCVYLKGIDTGSGNVWITGGTRGIDGVNTETTMLENINVKNCTYGFYQIPYAIFKNCTATGCSVAFYGCSYSTFNNCGATTESSSTMVYSCDYCNFIDCEFLGITTSSSGTGIAFNGCSSTEFEGCSFDKIYKAFYSCSGTFANCTISNGGYGFENCSGSFDSCITTNNYYYGYYEIANATFTSCVASRTEGTSYAAWSQMDSCTFIDCSSTGISFYNMENCTLVNCSVASPYQTYNAGFNASYTSFTNCTATGCGTCGFFSNTSGNTYTNCSASGNCTSGHQSCYDPESPYYRCADADL